MATVSRTDTPDRWLTLGCRRASWVMHATIFWGFVILTLGTIEFFGKGVIEGFSLPLLSDAAPYLIAEDAFSVLVIVAVGYAMFRRLVTRPRRLNLSTEALVILLLILGLMVWRSRKLFTRRAQKAKQFSARLAALDGQAEERG